MRFPVEFCAYLFEVRTLEVSVILLQLLQNAVEVSLLVFPLLQLTVPSDFLWLLVEVAGVMLDHP